MKFIRLTQGKKAIVDDEDYEHLNQFKWIYSSRGYASRTKAHIFIHRIVMNCPDNMEIDHINGNRLDNRKENLRICTSYQNSLNTKKKKRKVNSGSDLKGVSKSGNKYRARITFNNKTIYLGSFNTEKEAAEAYDKAAKSLHGDYARLNYAL